MKELKRLFTLRTALLTAAVAALFASAAVLMAVSAADEVSPSDMSKSDVIDNKVITDSGIEPILTNEPPENLGEPVITMTTAKAEGETMNLYIRGQNMYEDLYVDYGDGNPVAYPEEDNTVKGSNIKIYGDNITSLYCYNNQLTALDVSKDTALTVLWCSENQLTALDVSKNTVLTRLRCDRNQLTALDVSKNTDWTTLRCEWNQLTMPQIESITKTVQIADYAPQTHVIPSTVKVGDAIDLSSEYSVDGTVTQFTWYDGIVHDGNCNVVTPATAVGGVFTFGEDAVGKTLVCMMANAKLPKFSEDGPDIDCRLTTTEVTIEAASTTTTATSTTATSTTTTTKPSEDNRDKAPYYDLEVVNLDDGDDITLAGHGEGVTVTIDGKIEELRRIKGIHLTVGTIDENNKKSVLEAIANRQETFNADSENIALYDIDLSDGTHTHIKVVNGSIAIRIKYPDNLARQPEDYTFHLYHQKDDGTVEEIPLIVKPDGLWFYATDFSPYVLTWEEKAEPSANTGESAIVIVVMAGLFALSLAGAGFVAYRRRKLTAE